MEVDQQITSSSSQPRCIGTGSREMTNFTKHSSSSTKIIVGKWLFFFFFLFLSCSFTLPFLLLCFRLIFIIVYLSYHQSSMFTSSSTHLIQRDGLEKSLVANKNSKFFKEMSDSKSSFIRSTRKKTVNIKQSCTVNFHKFKVSPKSRCSFSSQQPLSESRQEFVPALTSREF